MLELENIDYEKIGFRGGLEIHHQIRTERKLFCKCKPILSEGEPDYRFERYFRPVLGEMGDFDEGMLIEYEKGYRVIYHAFEESVCIYEQDEQPPFWPDKKAIYLGFELAHWLNFSALVDEVVVSRKQYLDGSITTGFQRTMIVARDGWVPVNGKKLGISNLTVEEDSARKVKTENFGRTVYYNLDRLGIPLVEVITDHRDCKNPTDLKRLAEYIGLTLRLSGIGKRGIGVVRQDVNISISGGNRVEIKGVQDLDMFLELAKREVVRQDMLITISKKLKKIGFKKDNLEHTYTDFSDKFSKEDNPKNYIIMGIRLPKFGGILGLEIQPGKDFGQDILEKAQLISGIPMCNLYHSDELVKDSFRKQKEKNENIEDIQENFFFPRMTKEKDQEIREILNLTDKDAYVLAMGPQIWVIHALKKVVERAKMALDGVPQETRRLLPNGNTEFLRVIHGKDRLYPDTDTPPIDMDIEKIARLKKKVEKRPWELEREFKKKYDFSYQQVSDLIRAKYHELIVRVIKQSGVPPQRAYQFLIETARALSRDGYDINVLSEEQIIAILKGAQEAKYDFSIIPEIAKRMIISPDKKLRQVLSDLRVREIKKGDLQRFYKDALKEYEHEHKHYEKLGEENKQRKAQKITGIIVRRLHGGYSGKRIYDYVIEQLNKKKSNN